MDKAAISIHPEGDIDLTAAEAEEDSSKPKILQIRVGKVMEKNHRVWSAVCLCRNDSTASHAARICSGDEAASTVAAISEDFD